MSSKWSLIQVIGVVVAALLVFGVFSLVTAGIIFSIVVGADTRLTVDELEWEVWELREDNAELEAEVATLKALMAEPHERLERLETSDKAFVNTVCGLDAWARDLTGLFVRDVAEMQMEFDALSEEEKDFMLEDEEIRGLFALASYLDTPNVCEKADPGWMLVE